MTAHGGDSSEGHVAPALHGNLWLITLGSGDLARVGARAGRTLAPGQDKGTAPVLRSVVNLLPEADKVVDRRNRGNQDGEVASDNGRPFHWDDEPSELPLVPVMGQDRGN